jgi:P pilus assembly chaperone PapD
MMTAKRHYWSPYEGFRARMTLTLPEIPMAHRFTHLFRSIGVAAFVLAAPLATAPVQAAGDLLVAPTRVVLDGQRGTEVILNNIGDTPATYRVSLEIKRMQPDGTLVDVVSTDMNPSEAAAAQMIVYAPRRVDLPPNQPQAIRINIRPSADLPDGEYRAHLLFRAIPAAPTVGEIADGGLAIELIPIYGITIPIIVRHGELSATAAVSSAQLVATEDGPTLQIALTRAGNRSIYGELRVTKEGVKDPVVQVRGIAIYPEVDGRTVSLQITPEQSAMLRGPVTIGYYEPADQGGGKIAELKTVLQ